MAKHEQDQKAACRRMALATYDIADRCDDPDMIGAYLALAGRWLSKADAASFKPGSVRAPN